MLLAAIIFFFLPPSFLECHSLWREQNREGTYAKTSRVRMATGLFNFLFFFSFVFILQRVRTGRCRKDSFVCNAEFLYFCVQSIPGLGRVFFFIVGIKLYKMYGKLVK
ncbi:unnamed protein product [Ixodes persulcatus]